MTEELKKYESSIPTKYSFGYTPSFEEEFRTNLNKTVFFPIAREVIEKLGWELIYEGESSIEARKNAEAFHWGQKISISYQYGKITVNSKSIQSPFIDFGRNSKRVKLFVYAFKKLEEEHDKDSLIKLEEEVNRVDNWEDYEIPDTLPLPKNHAEPKIRIPVIGGVFISILLGFILAYLTMQFMYIIGVYEVAAGFLIGFGFKYLIKFSNYTNFDRLNYILIGVVLMTYISNQFFLYDLIMMKNNIEPIGFFNFMQLRFQEGLTIKSMNTGWIGLVLSWIFQIGFMYGTAYIQLLSNLTQYQLEKVPMEVVNFTIYHSVKGKDENEIRQELSKMGWSSEDDQNDVFESIGAIQGMQDLNRMD